jgi:hypothetical protein
MGFRVVSINYNELTADPGSPSEGEFWYNTTDQALKGYINGTTQIIIDKATFDAHVLDAGNPHVTTLDLARLAGNILSGDINMNGHNLINVGSVGAGYDAASQSWVADQINQKLNGWDWQESVLDKDLVTAPVSPAVGDRYIIAGIGGGWSGGTINDIAEWDGAAWIFSTPDESTATIVEDEGTKGVAYLFSGVSWGAFGEAIDHGTLTGKGDDDHTQYLLVSGARPMSGDFDVGGNNVTNVNLVDGVDVSAHAARHITAAADEIDGDRLDIDFTPANYTPDTTPAEVTNVDHLSSHLKGIDNALAQQALDMKAGRVLAASFAGNPKKATVTFSTAFPDANYAATITSVTQNNKQFAPAVESQVAGAFVINMGSNNITDLIQVNWIAMVDGESA